jgi:HTH-type transcriptional regulator / antitoxin HigA
MNTAPDFKDALQASIILQGFVINNDDDLERLAEYAEVLDEKIREGKAELQALYEYIIEKITVYENEEEEVKISGVSVLRFLMDQHNHRLKDMIDIAPMSVISEVLNGKRELNKGQIERLASKYNVSPALFF